MFANTSLGHTVRLSMMLFVTLSVGACLSGCSDDSLADPISASQSQINVTQTADTTSPTTEPTTSAFIEWPDDTGAPNVQDNQLLTVAPNEPNNETTDAGQSFVANEPSPAFLALQRLLPTTEFTYRITADGALINERIHFESGSLVDEGTDSTLAVLLSSNSAEVCRFEPENYLCVRLFDDGLGMIKVFTLAASNQGNGVFQACSEIIDNITRCVDELINVPTGSIAVSAGVPNAGDTASSALLDNHLAYLQSLALSSPSVTHRATVDESDWIGTFEKMLTRSKGQ